MPRRAPVQTECQSCPECEEMAVELNELVTCPECNTDWDIAGYSFPHGHEHTWEYGVCECGATLENIVRANWEHFPGKP